MIYDIMSFLKLHISGTWISDLMQLFFSVKSFFPTEKYIPIIKLGATVFHLATHIPKISKML